MAKDYPNEHFMRCPECGMPIDMRDLYEVFKHQHSNEDLKQAKGIIGKKLNKKDGN